MRIRTIIFKDLRLLLRDRNALIYMLLAPLLIGLIMGAAFGKQFNSESPVTRIPTGIVNADSGELGKEFVEILGDIKVQTGDGEEPLFDIVAFDDKDTARQKIEAGSLRGMIYLPPGFSDALKEVNGEALIELYTDPTRSVSPAILREVSRRIVSGFNTLTLGTQLSSREAFNLAMAAPQAEPATQAALQNLEEATRDLTADFRTKLESRHITIHNEYRGEAQSWDIMSYFMPAMAIFFLMFAMFAGTRSILEEEKGGTLPRLMTTPTSQLEILLGKIGATLVKGILQMVTLALVSGLLFGVYWGNPVGVALLTFTTVSAAGGLGALVAAYAHDDNQAGILSMVISLVFGMLGGNFISVSAFPAWLDALSKLTINRWALDGFIRLALDRAPVSAILPHAAVLMGMAVVFLVLGVFRFNKRFVK